jgi:hypothetical protein
MVIEEFRDMLGKDAIYMILENRLTPCMAQHYTCNSAQAP